LIHLMRPADINASITSHGSGKRMRLVP